MWCSSALSLGYMGTRLFVVLHWIENSGTNSPLAWNDDLLPRFLSDCVDLKPIQSTLLLLKFHSPNNYVHAVKGISQIWYIDSYRQLTYPCTECHPPFQSRSKTATVAYGKEETVGGRWSLIMTSKSPGSGDGIRSTRTTGVFRALNFELFVKPVRSQFVATQLNLRIILKLITLAMPLPVIFLHGYW